MKPTKLYQQHLVYFMLTGLLLVLITNLITLHESQQQALQHSTHVSLQQAQQHLLQYAKQKSHLPCADGNGDGYSDVIQSRSMTNDQMIQQQTVLACQYPFGWLPDQTIQQTQLRDEEGQRFWYAKASNPNQRLQINGQPIALAVIISAGPALDWQTARRALIDEQPHLPLQPEHYLEASNAQKAWQSFSTLGSIDNNDRLTWITDWPSTL